MGTRWSALFHMPASFDVAPVTAAMQTAVGQVDGQMSTWTPASDLMRLNAALGRNWRVITTWMRFSWIAWA